MKHWFDQAVQSAGLTRLRLQPKRLPLRDAPALLKAARGPSAPPWLVEVVGRLEEMLPVPSSCREVSDGPFFRLPLHERCFYFTPPVQAGEAGSIPEIIAIKGTEPLAEDCGEWLQEMRERRMKTGGRATTRLTEHFARRERKVPAALSLSEAEAEATAAAAVQSLHLRHYGELARLPLPLAVYRLPSARLRRFRARLRQTLSPRAFSAITPVLSGGLGAYAYYYPIAPMRVLHLDRLLPADSFAQRLEALREWGDPELVVGRWVTGFVRLLYLGYLPAALGSRGQGNCCNPKNAVIDGGFVDLDSIIAMSEIRDEAILQATLDYSFQSLVRTVRTYLVGAAMPDEPNMAGAGPVGRAIDEHVRALARKALARETRPGLTLSSCVSGFFATADTPAGVLQQLAKLLGPGKHSGGRRRGTGLVT